MFDLIRKILQTKTVTKTRLFDEAPSRYRGKPVFSSNVCTGCRACVTFCPSGAINYLEKEGSFTLSISYIDCIYCGVCAEQCATKMITATNEYRMATKNKNDLTAAVTGPLKTQVLASTGKGV